MLVSNDPDGAPAVMSWQHLGSKRGIVPGSKCLMQQGRKDVIVFWVLDHRASRPLQQDKNKDYNDEWQRLGVCEHCNCGVVAVTVPAHRRQTPRKQPRTEANSGSSVLPTQARCNKTWKAWLYQETQGTVTYSLRKPQPGLQSVKNLRGGGTTFETPFVWGESKLLEPEVAQLTGTEPTHRTKQGRFAAKAKCKTNHALCIFIRKHLMACVDGSLQQSNLFLILINLYF